MGSLITAVVIDDHEAVRDGIGSWCADADPPITILASGASPGLAWAGDGASADVVILDLQLAPGGMQEFGELRRLVQAGRRVVVYTGDGEKKTALRCISHGAYAFVAKSEGKDHLVQAVQAAADDKAYTPPSLSGSILADLDPSRPKLAPMEIEALRTWFSCASKELAGQILGLSPKTVNGYIERVRVKYAAVGRPAPTKSVLVQRALEDGLITLAELQDDTGR